MSKAEQSLRESVRKKYAEIATAGDSCCGPTCCSTNQSETGEFSIIGDAYDGVDGYVANADLGLGCGLPVEYAGLEPGDTVLDLGAGAGLDSFVARREVGETGQIIGVDMTPEMIHKARENTDTLGYTNVEFRLGEIESLPVESDSIDVAISNCVLNLVPNKKTAFDEIYRTLKPGGHFCISDIVASQALPDWTMKVAELYVGCVAGAMPKDKYLELISHAGFENVEIKAERRIDIPDDVIAELATEKQISAARASDLHVVSVTITGRKPRVISVS